MKTTHKSLPRQRVTTPAGRGWIIGWRQADRFLLGRWQRRNWLLVELDNGQQREFRSRDVERLNEQ